MSRKWDKEWFTRLKLEIMTIKLTLPELYLELGYTHFTPWQNSKMGYDKKFEKIERKWGVTPHQI